MSFPLEKFTPLVKFVLLCYNVKKMEWMKRDTAISKTRVPAVLNPLWVLKSSQKAKIPLKIGSQKTTPAALTVP